VIQENLHRIAHPLGDLGQRNPGHRGVRRVHAAQVVGRNPGYASLLTSQLQRVGPMLGPPGRLGGPEERPARDAHGLQVGAQFGHPDRWDADGPGPSSSSSRFPPTYTHLGTWGQRSEAPGRTTLVTAFNANLA
jgi:hypothetical protein